MRLIWQVDEGCKPEVLPEDSGEEAFPPGHSRTAQYNRVKKMLGVVSQNTPVAVKRRMMARLQAELLPDEPSYDLQREVFLQHCASVGELSSRDASRSTKRPRETRSAVLISSVPSKQSKASWREYSVWAGCDVKSVTRHAKQRDEMEVAGGELYILIRKVEVNVDKLYYEVQGLEYWLKIADPRNLGNQKYNKVLTKECQATSSHVPLQDQVKPKGCRGDDSQYMQKEFLRVSVEEAYAGYIESLPEARRADAPGLTKFRTWRPYWVQLREARHAIGCVCVHHATHELLEAALKKVRSVVHRSKGGHHGACRFGERCDCACTVCLDDRPLLQAAVCSTDGGLPRLKCVLQECENCGLDKALMCQKKEARNQAYLEGSVRLMKSVTRSIPGHKDRNKVEPATVSCNLETLFKEVQNTFSFTLMHDYLAKRLSEAFHFDLYNLPANEEIWVMDYIENFSCFHEYALQQDHYGHNSVTIFVILCIRHRVQGEHVQPTYKLPGHLTAELHAFLSEDMEHDSGFAQLCIHSVLQSKEKSGSMPERVRNWSDGGRAHFKNLRQLLFMSEVARRYGTKWWWNFFQSCHGAYQWHTCLAVTMLFATGKGMHDGAGAWLKSAVARACLAGVGISSVLEFFQYCAQFLETNTTKSNFTTERHFYLITPETVSLYRATMPSKVTGSKHILSTGLDKTGWFFWATTDEVGTLVQRRCACPCANCQDLNANFAACLLRAEDSSEGQWWNEPQSQVQCHTHLILTMLPLPETDGICCPQGAIPC